MSYQVKAGDTLSKIARRHGVTVDDIVKVNPKIKNPDHIETGWVLKLPDVQQVPGKGDDFKQTQVDEKPAPKNILGGEISGSAPATVAATDAASLTDLAKKAEGQVMAQATQLAKTQDPQQAKALLGQLKGQFGQWQSAVSKLVAAGQVDSPLVKSFAQKMEQASVLQANIPDAARNLVGAAYRDAVQGTITSNCIAVAGQTAASVVADNPLLSVPALTQGLSLAAAEAKGIPTTEVTIEGKTGQVRTDVVMVMAPGVVRTGKEFTDMRAQALMDGVATARAETGTFMDPDKNADAIAAAIKQARDMVGNPNAKVMLLGYSQGNTNVYAFMRDKDGTYKDLVKDVVGIHNVHSAAQGSQLADFAFAAGQYLTTSQPLNADQEKLLDAFTKAQAVSVGHPEMAKTFRDGLTVLHDSFAASRLGIRALDKVAGPALQALGLHGLSDEDLNKRFLAMAIKGTRIDDELANHGAAGKLAAKALQPLMKVLEASPAAWIRDPALSPMFQQYVDGGLKSLTTGYCNELMNDPNLQKNLANVPILNSVGAIPQDRMKDLVPNSQKLLYDFFNELGLPNDYEVALPNQQLQQVLKSAIDLPADAIGHWGVTGVIVPVDHTEKYFQDWSPAGMTHAVLGTFHQMGVL